MELAWKLIKEWTASTSGVITIVLIALSLSALVLGVSDLATILAIVGVVVSVYSIMDQKGRELQLIKDRVTVLEQVLEGVAVARYEPLRSVVREVNPDFVSWWKKRWIEYAYKAFIEQPTLSPVDLTYEIAADWLNVLLPDYVKYPALRDFLVYSFLRDNIPSCKAVHDIESKYSDYSRCVKDTSKRLFYGMVFTYYLQNKQSMNKLVDSYTFLLLFRQRV